MLKSPDPDFCPFAYHLRALFLNIFESISDLKVICTQSWGHIEVLWGPRSLKTSSQQHFSWCLNASDTLYNKQVGKKFAYFLWSSTETIIGL